MSFGDESRRFPKRLVAFINFPERIITAAVAIARIEEIDVEVVDQWDIGGIEPNCVAIGFIYVAVPAPGRRKHQVPGFHFAAPSVDDGHRPFRPRREPDRGRRMPMRQRFVAGLEHCEGR